MLRVNYSNMYEQVDGNTLLKKTSETSEKKNSIPKPKDSRSNKTQHNAIHPRQSFSYGLPQVELKPVTFCLPTVCRQGIIACNNNNMRNSSIYYITLGYECCYCCMQLSFACIQLVEHLSGMQNVVNSTPA